MNIFTAENQIAYVCDLSDNGVLRISGPGAHLFLSTMFSGNLEPLQQSMKPTQGMLLNSESQIIDVVDVVCTGPDEFLMRCSADNREEVLEWLSAHGEIEDDNGPVFEGLSITEQHENVGTLVLYGGGARKTMQELLDACGDRVPLIACDYPENAYGVPADPAILLFVPINLCQQIGDFLADLFQVEVLEYQEYLQKAIEAKRYHAKLADAEYCRPGDLDNVGQLIRREHDFVGGRGL